MHNTHQRPKRALISVSDKAGLLSFAKCLQKQNIEIISTGGTAKHLVENNIEVTSVESITDFPEIMNGRVKTLHPKIAGGILGLRDQHAQQAQEHNIDWIDIVICNLYPFANTIANPETTLEQAIEQIDIGGPTMLRAAAKNFAWVTVITDPNDYDRVASAIENQQLDITLRQELAAKVFSHTAHYDAIINNYLNKTEFPNLLTLPYEKKAELRYGENPHQAACVYQTSGTSTGLINAKQHQGKTLSYNNYMDADAALNCVNEFQQPACAIIKHAVPCGVAVTDDIELAFTRAYQADSQSAFGGIIALNQTCSEELAQQITQHFFEIVIAPDYEPQALAIFTNKPNLRVLQTPAHQHSHAYHQRFITNGVLIQATNQTKLTANQLTTVTENTPNAEAIQTALFAWQVIKYVKSNAILIANHNTTLGIGSGQVSRVDAVKIALRKAEQHTQGAVLASDAFFPFRDSIDLLAPHGITTIIQPGGSKRDQEVIDACNEHGIAMLFTQQRAFYH